MDLTKSTRKSVFVIFKRESTVLIKNGHIKTMNGKDYENGYVLARDNGKIIDVGDMSRLNVRNGWDQSNRCDGMHDIARFYRCPLPPGII